MMGQQHTPEEKVRFGPFEADLKARELRKFGIRVKLQDQPFKLLVAFLENPGELITREDLQKRLWGGDIVVDFDHSLGTALNKVREALSDSPDHPRYIETLPRRGYRFIAPVQLLDAAATPAVNQPPSANGKISMAVVTEPAETHQGLRTAAPGRHIWLLAAACTAVVLLAWLGPWRWRRTPDPPMVRYTEITRSGRVYLGNDNIERYPGMGTDGVRIYFSEIRDGKPVLASCSLSGGESQVISTPAEIVRPTLSDISRDGSTLLVRSQPLSELEGPLWIVPSSGGGASRVPGAEAHAASWMPDSKGIIYASGRDLMTMRSIGSSPQRLATLPGRAFGIRYSPDGSHLRFTIVDSLTHGSSLWETTADGQRLHPMLPGWRHPPAECCGNWTADGAYYVFQSGQGGANDIWALDERPRLFGAPAGPVEITAGPLSYQLPVPAAGSGRLFVIGAHTRTQLLRLDQATGRLIPWPINLNARRVVFSADGEFVAWVALNDGSLWRSRLDGSQRLRLTSPPLQVFRAAWSPDGRRLAFDAREPGRQSRIYLIGTNGGVPEVLLHEERNQADPSWSADGNSIVFGRLPGYLGEDSAEKSIYILDLKSRKPTQLSQSAGLFSPRWSPDGRRIATMPLNQEALMIFDLSSGEWTRVALNDTATSPTWSRDSKAVYFKAQQQNSVYRVSNIGGAEPRLEKVAGMEIFQSMDSFNLVGLSPENSPLLHATSATSDIYSVAWAALSGR